MRCKTHRRYKAKLRPRVSCIDCWLMFLEGDVDLYIIEDAIKYYEGEKGCWSIEFSSTDDVMVYHLLIAKRNEIINNGERV